MPPHFGFNRAQAPVEGTFVSRSPQLLPKSIDVGAQPVTLPLGTTGEKKPESAAAGPADLSLGSVELTLQTGTTSTRADLTKLAGFMFELPTDAGIRLRYGRGEDDRGEGRDRGGKNRVFLHVLRSLLLKPPW
jgi:hypothetical protein